MTKWTTRLALAFIVLVYLVLAVRYAQENPTWQVPDEPAHYNYIRQFADTGDIPVMEIGDWDSDYQNSLINSGFNPQLTDEIDRIQYQDHQPPLYYVLASPLFQLSDGDVFALRLFSVVIGALLVITAYFAIALLFPQQPWIALASAAFIGFLPQNLLFLSGINNDPFAQWIVALNLLAVVYYLKRDENSIAVTVGMGVLVGLAFLTKSTIYYVSGIAGIAILLKWRRLKWPRQTAARQIAAFLIPALLIGSIWWIRNVDVYGGIDFLGLQQHDLVAGAQLQTDDYINDQLGGSLSDYWRNFTYTTFHSFWGQFGWMTLPMPIRVYRILLVVTLLVLVGAAIHARREQWFGSLAAYQRETLGLFALSFILVFVAYLIYNRQFVQFQGRYLFPALLPVACLVGVGLTGWAGLLVKRAPVLRWVPVPIVLLLGIFAWYALMTYIVPNLPNWE